MICNIQDGSSVSGVHHMWPEKAGFIHSKSKGIPAYTFWHFFNSVELLTPNGMIVTEPDACYLCPPDTQQYFVSYEPLQHDYIYFDEATAQIWKRCGLEYEHIYYPHPCTYVSDIVWSIEMEYASKNQFYEDMINAKIYELFITMSRVCNGRTISVSKEMVERFHQIRLKMLDHLNENWTVARMAVEVNISPSYFHAVYKEIYGTSPTQDLINARISNAKYMLQYSRESIANISKNLGYNSPYHFTRQFRQMTGESPSKYRSRNT